MQVLQFLILILLFEVANLIHLREWPSILASIFADKQIEKLEEELINDEIKSIT